jgi:hypothetical protein
MPPAQLGLDVGADFLEDLILAVAQQLVGIGTLDRVDLTILDNGE